MHCIDSRLGPAVSALITLLVDFSANGASTILSPWAAVNAVEALLAETSTWGVSRADTADSKGTQFMSSDNLL